MFFRHSEPPKKRLKKITKINTAAQHWCELIELSQAGICEPALTEAFSEQELEEALQKGNKLELPDLPAHSQSVERAVKLTSEVSHVVYGYEARHKTIITKQLGRQLRSPFGSKGAYKAQFDEMDF